MSLFTSWLASPPPDAAIEIAPERVSVAVVGDRSGGPVVQAHASEALPAGAVVASLTGSNIHNKALVAGALRSVLERAGVRPRRVALVIPDLAAKVSLVRFERFRCAVRIWISSCAGRSRRRRRSRSRKRSSPVTPAVHNPDGSAEFLVVSARRRHRRGVRSRVRSGTVYAGLVDLATFSIVNLILGGPKYRRLIGSSFICVRTTPPS